MQACGAAEFLRPRIPRGTLLKTEARALRSAKFPTLTPELGLAMWQVETTRSRPETARKLDEFEQGQPMNPTAQETVSKVIDVDELLTRCMGNVDIAERILAKFQERFNVDLDELQEAINSDDVERFTRTAHRIKGSSANVAAHAIFRIATELEQLGRAERLSEAVAGIELLQTEWTRFVDSISALDLSQYPTC